MAPPILQNVLTQDERIILAQLSQQPGYKILVRLHDEECRRLNEAVIKLDPTEQDYEKRLMATQMEARAVNKFSVAILGSVAYHTDAALDAMQNPVKEGPI